MLAIEAELAARRPLGTTALILFAQLAALAALAQAPASQPQDAAAVLPDRHQSTEATNLYRLIRRFDFDERHLGNYEDLPKGWQRLSGPGLPPHATARFDEETGAQAAPSLKMGLAGGGNIAIEYSPADLTAVTHSDYVITAAVRTEGLEHGRALVAAYFVDRYGDRIEGSARISRLVGDGETQGRWTPVRVELPGEFLRAASLRIQLWILQEYCWWQPDPNRPDPILVQDVRAAAWFDDVQVYRLPRARLRLSESSGAIEPNTTAQLALEISNATPFAMEALVEVANSEGKSFLKERLRVLAEGDPLAGGTRAPSQRSGGPSGGFEAGPQTATIDVPHLPSGTYVAQARLMNGNELLLERSIQFVSLPELPFPLQPRAELGMDVGVLPPASVEGLRRLLLGLGCGAAKVWVPAAEAAPNESSTEYYRRVSAMARDFAENRVETVAVLLSPGGRENLLPGAPTRFLLEQGTLWKKQLDPLLAELGGLFSTWQLGDARVELRGDGRWSAWQVEELRSHLKRFVTLPQIVTPADATRELPSEGDSVSVLLPSTVASRHIPLQLESLVRGARLDRWIDIEPGPHRGRRAIAELAQRVTLLRALGADRIYLPALVRAGTAGGQYAWEPDEDYIAMRTLLSALAGRKFAGLLTPAEESIALIFDRGGDDLAVVWSWESGDAGRSVDLFLGPEPKAIDLFGQPVALHMDGGTVRVPLRAMPLIVYNVSAALSRIQSSFRLTPTSIQLHESTRPVLEFTNHFNHPMAGELHVDAPEAWRVKPEVIPFALAPGETLRQELSLSLPPRQLASTEEIAVEVVAKQPKPATLKFRTPISVRLSGLNVDAKARWDGDDLIVEQSLENQSDAPVRFTGFCDAERRPRQQRAFLDVAPGETRLERYVFPQARELAGTTVYLGVREIQGSRRLEQLVDVPR